MATGRIGGVGGGVTATRRPGRGAAGFAVPVRGGEAQAAATAPAAGVTALLALQEEFAPPPGADERARRRGTAALAELHGLQLDLLRGGIESGRLSRLAALAEAAEEGADPALRVVLAEVALRVKVELARHRAAARGRIASGP